MKDHSNPPCGTICDLCGKASDKFGGWSGKETEIAESDCRVSIRRSVIVKIGTEAGRSYREDGGHTVQTKIDICLECFKAKLVPWLTSQGATVTENEIDW